MRIVLWSFIALLTISACNTENKKSKDKAMQQPEETNKHTAKLTTQPDSIINVTRSTNGDYLLSLNKEDKLTIEVNNEKNKISVSVGGEKEQKTSISCSYPQDRYIFKITDNDTHEIFYVSERHIPMQGTPNFRDLGGIVTKDGKQIRWGAIFRSGALADLTPTDLAYFKTLKIGKVIDFRTPSEIEREPDRYPDSNVIGVHAMIGNPADLSPITDGKNIASITPQQADEYMLKAYGGFTNSLTDFQPIFDAMINDGPDKPFLFHCTAGKDRTGISGALILTALNVDREIIFNDYLLSNTYNVPFFENNLDKMRVYGFTDDVIKVMSSVKREYLQSVFDAIDSQYASDAEMLEKVFGITPEKRQQLIEKYTY